MHLCYLSHSYDIFNIELLFNSSYYSFFLVDYNVSLLPIWANRVTTLQYDVIPVYRTIEHFSVHKRNEAVLFTEPFYTRQGGYKLALCVYPNGFGSVKGTYLSVFAGLMKGENDQSLPFPFSGIIVIKLLNWMQDAKHVEDSLPFDEATLVKYREQLTTGQMITGPGYDILPHTKLMEESSDHQYLYEDKLCFQILFEPIQQTGQNNKEKNERSPDIIFNKTKLFYCVEFYIYRFSSTQLV